MEVFGADTVASCPSTLMEECQLVELPPHASWTFVGGAGYSHREPGSWDDQLEVWLPFHVLSLLLTVL